MYVLTFLNLEAKPLVNAEGKHRVETCMSLTFYIITLGIRVKKMYCVANCGPNRLLRKLSMGRRMMMKLAPFPPTFLWDFVNLVISSRNQYLYKT